MNGTGPDDATPRRSPLSGAAAVAGVAMVLNHAGIEGLRCW